MTRDDLILNLCAEAGDDVETDPSAVIEAFRANHNAQDIDAAAAGDVEATVRLRQACGLPVFR